MLCHSTILKSVDLAFNADLKALESLKRLLLSLRKIFDFVHATFLKFGGRTGSAF